MVSAPVCGEALGEGAAGDGGFTPAQAAVRSTKSSPTMSAARINGSPVRISFIGFSRVTFYDTPHCLNTVTSSAVLNAVLWANVVDCPWSRVPGTEYSEPRTRSLGLGDRAERIAASCSEAGLFSQGLSSVA